MKETLELAPDWAVELNRPKCELDLPECDGAATHAIRVHGCAFHYACDHCRVVFRRRVRLADKNFEKLTCKECRKRFDRSDYYQIVKL